MVIRFFYTILVFAAVAGYAADAVACYEERLETHCTTEHSSSQDSHQECHDCVCHMPADLSPEVLDNVFFFGEVKLTIEHSPTYYQVTSPDLQPPRLS